MSTIVSPRRSPSARAAATNPLDARVARALAGERQARQWSLADLADRSGVSRAMIAKIERGDARPTASLLGRLSAAFGLPLSAFFSRIETGPKRLARAADQPVWQDPATGYVRRALTPVADEPLQLTHVRLPPRARVSYPAEAYTFVRQQIWVLQGTLRFEEGGTVHTLHAGDCLALGAPSPCTFANTSRRGCEYLVAVTRKG